MWKTRVHSHFKPFTHFCRKLANVMKYAFFWRNFFASKNHVAEIFWQILCMTLQKIYSSNYIHCHLSLDHTHFTARWNLHSSVIYTIYHLQMHIFDDQKLEAPTFNFLFISLIFLQLTFPGLSEQDRMLKDSLAGEFSGWHGAEVKATLCLAAKAALSWRDSPTLSPPFSCTLDSWLYFLYLFYQTSTCLYFLSTNTMGNMNTTLILEGEANLSS